MPDGTVEGKLAEFAEREDFHGKGPLSVALVVTERARTSGLPLDPTALLTEGGGQVAGLGRGAVQAILARHGITATLAAEGGRTSRNSLANMRTYVAFLNSLAGPVELGRIEGFWIERVRSFFAGKPFRLRLDASAGIRAVIAELLDEARRRQKSGGGVKYAGAVLQHLVGAKLQCALPGEQFQHHGSSAADSPGGRAGDFEIGDVAIHVTTAPGDGVIDRCRENIQAGLRPVIITVGDGTAVATGLARQAELGGRIDVLDAEQFVATNVYELGRFTGEGRRTSLTEIIQRYNEIVAEHETDPSLKIEVRP